MITTIEPAAVLPPPAPSPSHPVPVSPSQPLSPRDEDLLATFLNASYELPTLAKAHKLSLQAVMDWYRQPHIKAAIETLTEMASARAKFIAANDATHAITALQNCVVLGSVEFHEQPDPNSRLRAFENARKAATLLLKLGGLPMARPRPASAGRGVRGSARTERGVPVSEPASGCHGSSGSAASRAQLSPNGSVNGHSNGRQRPSQPPSDRISRAAS